VVPLSCGPLWRGVFSPEVLSRVDVCVSDVCASVCVSCAVCPVASLRWFWLSLSLPHLRQIACVTRSSEQLAGAAHRSPPDAARRKPSTEDLGSQGFLHWALLVPLERILNQETSGPSLGSRVVILVVVLPQCLWIWEIF